MFSNVGKYEYNGVNSGGMVKVTNISLDTTDSGWKIVDYETDFTQEKVGLKQFGITINEDEVATECICRCHNRLGIILSK